MTTSLHRCNSKSFNGIGEAEKGSSPSAMRDLEQRCREEGQLNGAEKAEEQNGDEKVAVPHQYHDLQLERHKCSMALDVEQLKLAALKAIFLDLS